MVGNQDPIISKNGSQETPLTEEDKLAQKLDEGGFDQQNKAASEIDLASIVRLSIEGISVYKARELLRGEIDINKLTTDPKYKAEIENAAKLVNKYGWLVKKGELIEKVPKIERVVEKTTACHNRLVSEKSVMLLDDNLYLRRLQSAYNLTDEQLQSIKYSAWAKVRENPSLSIKDALRIDAENFILKQAIKEVEKENKGKKLTREEKETLIEKKLTEKHVNFETSLTTIDAKTGVTKSYAEYENKRIDAIIKAQVEENRQILTTQPLPPSPSSQPIITAPPPPTPPPLMSPMPVSIPRFNLPSMPTFSFPPIPLGGLSGGLKSVFGSGGLLSKGLSGLGSLASSLVKGALPRLASFAFPPVGIALTGGMIVQKLLPYIVGVVIFILFIPLTLGIGVFSHITGSNPMTVSTTAYINDKTLSWDEFNKQYLLANTDMQLSWQQFTEGNFMLDKKYLSLDPNRHNDVKK